MEQNIDVFDFTLTDEDMTPSPRWTPANPFSSTTETRSWSVGSTGDTGT